MAEFHAPYAIIIAALIAKNLTLRTVAGCTFRLLARHNGHLFKNAGHASSSGLSAIYPANSSSISMRSSRQYLQSSDTITQLSKDQFLLPIGQKSQHFLTVRNNSHYPDNAPSLCGAPQWRTIGEECTLRPYVIRQAKHEHRQVGPLTPVGKAQQFEKITDYLTDRVRRSSD